MNLLNTIGYDPLDDDSDSGYRRPPRDPKAVCDYFLALSFAEDEGAFAGSEMQALLDDADVFFGTWLGAWEHFDAVNDRLTLVSIVRATSDGVFTDADRFIPYSEFRGFAHDGSRQVPAYKKIVEPSPPPVRQRGVDFPCEECGALGGNFEERGWYRCKKCGHPGQ